MIKPFIDFTKTELSLGGVQLKFGYMLRRYGGLSLWLGAGPFTVAVGVEWDKLPSPLDFPPEVFGAPDEENYWLCDKGTCRLCDTKRAELFAQGKLAV